MLGYARLKIYCCTIYNLLITCNQVLSKTPWCGFASLHIILRHTLLVTSKSDWLCLLPELRPDHERTASLFKFYSVIKHSDASRLREIIRRKYSNHSIQRENAEETLVQEKTGREGTKISLSIFGLVLVQSRHLSQIWQTIMCVMLTLNVLFHNW